MNASDMNKQSKTDWAKLEEMEDKTIDLSDTPELGDDFFERATLRMPESVSVAVDIDPDVLAWFKTQVDAPKLMKAALRIYAEAHQKTL